MTTQKAIESMKNIIEYWTYKPTEVEATKLAIQALEKQVPLKAIETCMTMQACPNCKTKVNWNFCSECGQKIKY